MNTLSKSKHRQNNRPYALHCLRDNYIWLLEEKHIHPQTKEPTHDSTLWIIDPGSSEVILEHLKQKQFSQLIVLITHNHPDHTGGLNDVLSAYPTSIAFGPELPDFSHHLQYHALKKPTCSIIHETSRLTWQAMHTPGHTLDHISYHLPSEGYLFPGDTLFSAGCGRIFEGSAHDLFSSLNTLSSLPQDTLIFPAHEYTLQNLTFARFIEPDNQDILTAIEHTQNLIQKNQPTLPSRLDKELKINPFLRSFHYFSTMKKNELFNDCPDALSLFTKLRDQKDRFS